MVKIQNVSLFNFPEPKTSGEFLGLAGSIIICHQLFQTSSLKPLGWLWTYVIKSWNVNILGLLGLNCWANVTIFHVNFLGLKDHKFVTIAVGWSSAETLLQSVTYCLLFTMNIVIFAWCWVWWLLPWKQMDGSVICKKYINLKLSRMGKMLKLIAAKIDGFTRWW